jgi:hypothetical protein
VPKPKALKISQKIGTVTVTTPEGYRIEAFDVESAILILKSLMDTKLTSRKFCYQLLC